MTVPIDRAFLRALARHPRFAGSEALAAARGVCAEHLRALGYSVRERPFTFSTLPARFGMPEVKFGIPSGMEACLLPGLIGWGKTTEAA